MRITVALTPQLLREPASHAVVVVDVLRAASSLVTMFERGLIRAIVSPNVREARRMALANFSLLCGEVKSVPAPGFDYGNSPAEFAGGSFRGKSAVMMTTNGTRALIAAAAAPVVAVGALVNRRAVATRMLAEAEARRLDVAIVCAGRERGAAYSLEDAVAAGAIIEAAREQRAGLAMTDESWSALHLWRWYRGDAMRAFRESAHGRALRGLGFSDDLHFSAQLDVFESVPMLTHENGVPTLRTRKRRGSQDADPTMAESVRWAT